jgi:hypothetical protein
VAAGAFLAAQAPDLDQLRLLSHDFGRRLRSR